MAFALNTSASIIVADSFDRANNDSLGVTSTGGFAWSEVETVAGSGIRISGNAVVAGSTTSGRDAAFVDLGSASGYSSTLSENSGIVTWSINMRQTRPEPSGFDGNNYGMAFVLCSSANWVGAGSSGYAIVLGQSGDTDSIRVAAFNNGLSLDSSFTDIISSGDYGSEHLNVRVTYNPNGDLWSLYMTSGGSFSDPAAVTTQLGSTTQNSTYTGTDLRYTGMLWNHATGASELATFDNFSLQVVPEPVEWALFAFGAVFVGTRMVRCWRRCGRNAMAGTLR